MADQNNDNDPPRKPRTVTVVYDELGSKDGSAETTGTSQSTSGMQQHPVTVQPLPSEDGSKSTRRRPVTTHRRTLDYIQTDSFQNTRYPVPDQKRPRAAWGPKTVDAMKESISSRTGTE